MDRKRWVLNETLKLWSLSAVIHYVYGSTFSPLLPASPPPFPPDNVSAASPSTRVLTQSPAATTLEQSEVFKIVPKEYCSNSDAIFAIGGTAKLWRSNEKADWTSAPNPLNISIICNKDKWQTPLIARIKRLQRAITKSLKGRNWNNVTKLGEMHYVSVLKGEVLDQEVWVYEMRRSILIVYMF